MIKTFADRGTEDLFNRVATKAARKVCPEQVWKVARRKLDQINQAANLNDLRVPRQN
jgi:proteic killer suppression protein